VPGAPYPQQRTSSTSGYGAASSESFDNQRRSARGHGHREHAGDSGNIGSPQSRAGFVAEANLDPAVMDLMNLRSEPLRKVISMYKRMTLSSLILLALLGVSPLLGACHTTAGAGQDISKTGQAITRSANNATPR
jgi:predicted small secreted protein